MSVSIDVAWKSLNKHHEELCGDKVEVLKTDDSDILILADGMGSGVKANILATLTSKILGTMLYEGAALESCVETIAKTLPICQVRKVAYATFSVLQIFHSGEAYLVEFDNPSCVFIRDGKIVNYAYETREIEGKKIHEYRFQVQKNDCFVLMSDGVIYAGAGSILNLQGWTENTGHFGLAAKYYTHFTSPIRRYPDLQIHRIIKENLRGRFDENRAEHYSELLQQVAAQCSERERRAEEAEREVVKLKKAEYMRDHIGEEFDGVISGVTKWGAYVELENTVEGLAHVADMWDDHYEFYEQSYELVGEHTGKTYKPGQKVRICVTDADKLQRTVNFRIL